MARRGGTAAELPPSVFGELDPSRADAVDFMELMNQALSTAPDEILTKLVRTLTFKTAQTSIKKAGSAVMNVVGSHLRLPEHTAACAAVLANGLDSLVTEAQILEYLGLARGFLSLGDAEQMRAMPYEVGIICNALARHSLDHSAAMSTVRPLRRAADLLSPAKHLLTPAHSSFALVACRCKLYKDLCEISDTEVLGVMPRQTGIKVEDVLCFFYYSGIAYAAMKRWKRAVDSFSMCLVTPAAALSAVAVQAQKYRVLCSLIATGAAPGKPKAATMGMMQGLKRPTAAYSDIASAYASADPAALATEISRQEATLTADGMLGLVKQVVASQQSHRIRALTGTFLTVTLSEIAAKVGLRDAAEAETEVFRLVRLGMLSAKIDQESGVVSFKDSDDMADPARLASRVAELVGAATELAEAVAERDAELALSSDFVAHALQQAQHTVQSQHSVAAAAAASSASAGGSY